METIAEQEEITFWEIVARRSWGSYISEIEKKAILKAHTLAAKPTTALELGCDGGRWSKLISDLGWSMTCTDIDQHAINICKQRIPSAHCILVHPDDTTISCNAESMGLALCIEVPPVIQADWFIDETFRVLQKGGLIVGVFWNRRSFRGLMLRFARRFRGGYDWYRLSYPQWRKRFSERGFTFLHEEGFCWFPFRRDSNSSLVPVATQMERSLGLRRFINFSPWVVFIARKD